MTGGRGSRRMREQILHGPRPLDTPLLGWTAAAPLTHEKEPKTMSKLTESALGHAAAVLACLLITGGFAIAQVGQGALPDDGSHRHLTAIAGDNCPPGDPGDPVVFQYSIERSCRFSIVMIEESAEPLASDDPA